jgi:hypothetical protein
MWHVRKRHTPISPLLSARLRPATHTASASNEGISPPPPSLSHMLVIETGELRWHERTQPCYNETSTNNVLCKQDRTAINTPIAVVKNGTHCYGRGPGSLVSIATDYGLDGPGIESRWGGRDFPPVQTGSGAHPASCTMGTGSFPRA